MSNITQSTSASTANTFNHINAVNQSGVSAPTTMTEEDWLYNALLSSDDVNMVLLDYEEMRQRLNSGRKSSHHADTDTNATIQSNNQQRVQPQTDALKVYHQAAQSPPRAPQSVPTVLRKAPTRKQQSAASSSSSSSDSSDSDSDNTSSSSSSASDASPRRAAPSRQPAKKVIARPKMIAGKKVIARPKPSDGGEPTSVQVAPRPAAFVPLSDSPPSQKEAPSFTRPDGYEDSRLQHVQYTAPPSMSMPRNATPSVNGSGRQSARSGSPAVYTVIPTGVPVIPAQEFRKLLVSAADGSQSPANIHFNRHSSADATTPRIALAGASSSRATTPNTGRRSESDRPQRRRGFIPPPPPESPPKAAKPSFIDSYQAPSPPRDTDNTLAPDALMLAPALPRKRLISPLPPSIHIVSSSTNHPPVPKVPTHRAQRKTHVVCCGD